LKTILRCETRMNQYLPMKPEIYRTLFQRFLLWAK